MSFGRTPDRGEEEAHSQEAVARVDGVSRRGFLVGTGLTFAAASGLGRWVEQAVAATDHPAGLSAVGFTDAFDELAASGAPVGYRALAAVAASGASTVRFPLRWDLVHVEAGGFDWSAYDALHRQLVWHGLKALPVVIGAPSWLGAETKGTPAGVRYPVGAKALNGFGDFVVETIRHFTGLGNHIDAVEIWSEPNNPNGAYIAEPAEFSRMLATAAMSVEAENRLGRFQQDKAVVAGGLSLAPEAAPWQTYLGGLRNQYFPYAVGVHTGATTPRSARTAADYAEALTEQVVDDVAQVAEAAGGAPVWVTSTSATSRGPWGEGGQADALTSLSDGLAGVTNCQGMIVSPLYEGEATAPVEPGMSLLRNDGTPKSALHELGLRWAESA